MARGLDKTCKSANLAADCSGRIPFRALVLCGLALFTAFAAEELLGYRLLGSELAGFSLSSYVVLLIAQIPLAALCFACGPRVEDFVRCHCRPAALLLLLLIALGMFFSAMSTSLGVTSPFEVVGVVLLAIAAFGLKLVVLDLFARMPVHLASMVAGATFLLYPVMSPVLVVDGGVVWVLSGVCAMLCVVFAALAYRGVGSSGSSVEPAAPRFARPLVPSAPVFAGFGIYALCISFLNPLAAYGDLSFGALMWFTLATHLLAAILFCVLAIVFNDDTYTFASKGIGSIALFAFVLFALLGADNLLPRGMCVATFSLFEYASFLALVAIAASASVGRARLFGGYYLIFRLSALVGIMLGTMGLLPGGSPSLYAAIGVALAGLLIMASMWLLSEANLNAFFWGNTPQALAAGHAVPQRPDDHGAPDSLGFGAAELTTARVGDVSAMRGVVRSHTDCVSQAYGLTPKEAEVLRLIALGRSSTFIAEELTLSPNTIRKRIGSIYQKCGVHSKQDLLTLIQSATMPN